MFVGGDTFVQVSEWAGHHPRSSGPFGSGPLMQPLSGEAGAEKLPRKGKGQLWRVQMCAAAVQWRHQALRGAIYFII